jgi:hypothetical protein
MIDNCGPYRERKNRFNRSDCSLLVNTRCNNVVTVVNSITSSPTHESNNA